MPLPALIGLPALVTWLTGLATAVFAWIVARVGERIALGVAMAALTLTAILLAVGSVKLLLVGIVPSIPVVLVSALQTALPTNTDTLLGTVIAVEGVATAFSRWMVTRASV